VKRRAEMARIKLKKNEVRRRTLIPKEDEAAGLSIKITVRDDKLHDLLFSVVIVTVR
jgi:hypothetical protein